MSDRRPRVLIVDDDDDIRAVMAEALTDAGYYLAGLDNGAGVLDAIKAQRPDVILLDLYMPGTDGVQVLSQLRALESAVPVIVVTALPLVGTDLGRIAAVVPKPFELAALVGCVRRVLAGDIVRRE